MFIMTGLFGLGIGFVTYEMAVFLTGDNFSPMVISVFSYLFMVMGFISWSVSSDEISSGKGSFLVHIVATPIILLGIALIAIFLSGLIKPTVMGSLYGISINKPLNDSDIQHLSNQGKGFVVSRDLESKEEALWDYRFVNKKEPATEILAYMDEDKSNVLRVEVLIKTGDVAEKDENNTVNAKTLFDELSDAFEERQDWNYFINMFSMESTMTFHPEREGAWMKALGDVRSKASESGVQNEKIWTNGDRLLWLYIDGNGHVKVILQDSTALKAMYSNTPAVQ